MKVLYAVTFVALSFAQLHYRADPGCAKAYLPPNTYIEDCCPTLPRFYKPDLFDACLEFCGMWIVNPKEFGAQKCCILNCSLVLSGAMVKYGPYIPDAMIQGIKDNITDKAQFDHWAPIIEKVVIGCYKNSKKYNDYVVEGMSPQCETLNVTLALNTTHCIRRDMFFNCKDPQMTSIPNCKLLVDYGKQCTYWPWQCVKPKPHSGGGRNKTL